MIDRTLRTASACELATDRELLRAELLRHGLSESVVSCLIRVICELATNGACYGTASAVVVRAERVDLIELRIPGDPFDSVSATRTTEARGLADVAYLLRRIAWSWDWRWEGDEEAVVSSDSTRGNVIRLYFRAEGGE